MEQVATAEETAERVELIVPMLLRGMEQRRIVRYLQATHEWAKPLTKRWLRELVKRAEAALAEESRSIDRRAEFTKALNRYTFLYRKAVEQDDYKSAGQIQDRIVDLLNLASQPPLALDWREHLPEGVNAGELFEELVQRMLGSAKVEAS
jgi:hypothetical protein